jgi:phosphomethylpyrimidine synthase
MKITDDVRRYAEERGLDTEEAIQKGMEEMSDEFKKSGSEVYLP